jgi:hypothetical protein
LGWKQLVASFLVRAQDSSFAHLLLLCIVLGPPLPLAPEISLKRSVIIFHKQIGDPVQSRKAHAYEAAWLAEQLLIRRDVLKSELEESKIR